MNAYRMPGRDAVDIDEQNELAAFSRSVRLPSGDSFEPLKWSLVAGLQVIFFTLAAVGLDEHGTRFSDHVAAWTYLGLGLAFSLVIVRSGYRASHGGRLAAMARASALEGGRDDLQEAAPARVRFVLDELAPEVDEVPMIAEPGRLRADAEGHA